MSPELKMLTGFALLFIGMVGAIGYVDYTQPRTISDLTQAERDAVDALKNMELGIGTPEQPPGGGFGAPTRCLVLVKQPAESTRYHIVEFELRTFRNKHSINMTPIIEYLKQFPHLKRLVLPGCNSKQLARIKQLLPKCEVFDSYKDYRLKVLSGGGC